MRLKLLRESAAAYVAAGYAICRLQPGEKSPTYPGWSTRSIAPDQLQAGDGIGLLLGSLSHGGRPGHALLCADLDHESAIAAADRLLPATAMIDGREGKVHSHRFYLIDCLTIPSEDAATGSAAVAAAAALGFHPGPRKQQYRSGGRVMFELLGTGQQVVVPPSIHPSGQCREWINGVCGRPAVLPWSELIAATEKLAEACGWTRHHMSRIAGSKTVTSNLVVPHRDRVGRARSWLERVPGTTAGNGARARALGIAMSLLQGFDLELEEALPMLIGWGRQPDQTDEAGGWYPWNERELAKLLQDADGKADRLGRERGWKLTEERESALTAGGVRYADWLRQSRRKERGEDGSGLSEHRGTLHG